MGFLGQMPRGVVYHRDLVQGSEEWLQARLGFLTASEMKLIMTPSTLKPSSNKETRAHVFELLAQRITGWAPEQVETWDMLRGRDDEVYAREAYRAHFDEVEDMGFITNDRWGFTLGYSPDGMVGDDGLIEIKSRKPKFQAETIVKNAVPDDFVLQLQTGLLVSERKWIDFISYCGGMPMVTIRVLPDPAIQRAILEAASTFEAQVSSLFAEYQTALSSGRKLIPTERRIIGDISL